MLQQSRIITAVLCGLICSVLSGCGETPTIRRYTVPRENPHNLTSDLLRKQFPSVPFHWNRPETWTIAENDQFSIRAWKTGPLSAPARITLGQFPARTGIPAQILRWRRQLGLPAIDETEAMKHASTLTTRNGAGSLVEIEGDSESILAFILPIEQDFWIFRFRGPGPTAESERDRFRLFCESLEYVGDIRHPPDTSQNRSNSSADTNHISTDGPTETPAAGRTVPNDRVPAETVIESERSETDPTQE